MRRGEAALLRYAYEDGTLQAAFPVRVVEDSSTHLATWLSQGSQIMYWATTDGRDPRLLPLEERFSAALTSAPRHWEGPGVLRLLFPRQPYQVLHFWRETGEFLGWYVNLERPFRRSRNAIDTVDWHLDLEIDATGVGQWKDEDEARAAVDAGQLSSASFDLARQTGEQILNDIDSFLADIGDWRSFVPSSNWGPMALPPRHVAGDR